MPRLKRRPVAKVSTSPHTEHNRTEVAPMEIVRLSACNCPREAAVQHFDLARVAVLLWCSGCDQPRMALAGELPEVIDKLMDLYAAMVGMERESLYAEEDPAVPGESSTADIFGRWLARQAPGTIKPPPRPPRDASPSRSTDPANVRKE
jgi:hypothetical protein